MLGRPCSKRFHSCNRAFCKPLHLGLAIIIVAFFARSSLDASALLQTSQVNDDPALMVLSYSLYGTNSQYLRGMIATATEVPDSYPGWQVRVYHDNLVPSNMLSQLAGMSHVRLVNVEKDHPEWVAQRVNPMSWRFLVAADPTVKAYGVRDGDSKPSKREKAAVDEWLSSNRGFHVMRDHPMHDPSRFAAILGGMWGGLRRSVPHMEELLHAYYNNKSPNSSTAAAAAEARGVSQSFKYAEDQDFLWSQILPLARNDCFQHDSYYCRVSGGIAFPVSREDAGDSFGFVGNSFNRLMDVPRSTKDHRLMETASFALYNDCLELRQTIMSNFSHHRGGNETLPDTSFKGRSDLSSTEMWETLRTRGKSKPSQKVMVSSPQIRGRHQIKVVSPNSQVIIDDSKI